MTKTKKEKPVLEVRDIVARYGDFTVLDGISFDVHAGEILVILGKSGCGKSTLLRNMTMLYPPVSGSVTYWGQEVTKLDEDHFGQILERIGLSFQGGALFNSMSVFENVALPIRERTDLGEEAIKALVMIKLSLVGMAHAAYKMPSEISGGMKKRAGVARALALDPEMLFFDEPSAGLDPVTASGLDELILNMRRLLGVTIVVVTHELASIHTIADRVLMLHGGKAIFNGPLKEAVSSNIPELRDFFRRGRVY
jgi:phospholipid/cholesterol/gamma-HCH transport system ATP-binding protein